MGVDKSPIGSGTATRMPPRASWGLVPAGLVSASAVLLFGLQVQLAGYVVLGAALLLAFVINRALFPGPAADRARPGHRQHDLGRG